MVTVPLDVLTPMATAKPPSSQSRLVRHFYTVEKIHRFRRRWASGDV